MNTALTATATVTVPQQPASSWFARAARSVASAGRARRAESRYGREELAELHRLQQQAERLRGERFATAMRAGII